MRWKTAPPPAAPESATEILHQIGRALSEAGKALERLADAAPRFVPPPEPSAPERPPELPSRPRGEYINTKGAAEYISAQVVARRFGIKTGTLSKWRSSGRGPKGWFHLSATRFAYPEAAVDEFLRELKAHPPKFGPKRDVRQGPEGEP